MTLKAPDNHASASAASHFAYDAFVVHADAAADKAFVNGYLLANLGLAQERVLRLQTLELGRFIPEAIERGVRSSRVTIVVLSAAYIVESAVFSPDGTRIVTASYDHTARVWDARTGQPLSSSLQHQDIVVSVAFSPDGTRVVTASFDKTARIWDAGIGQPFSPPLQHQDLVLSAAFSPDGTRVVTASADHTARLGRPHRPATLLVAPASGHRGKCRVQPRWHPRRHRQL